MELKKNIETSEFQTSAASLLIMVITTFFTDHVEYLGFCAAFLIGSYILARALFKKNRGIYVHKNGYTTSEFYLYLASVVFTIFCVIIHHMDLAVAIVCLTVVQVSYNLGRGHTKTFTPPANKTTVIR
jgi:hypothetical protein